MAHTESFHQKATKFATYANESIESSFTYEEFQNTPRLKPLTLKYLSQEYLDFSEAFVEYEKQPACFRMESWYSFYFQKLLDVMRGKDNIDESDRAPFLNLFAFVNGNHLRCLQTLLQQEDLKERKIAAIIAIHYFKPLIPNGSYIVDESYQGSSTHSCCELCKEKINYGDTTLGNIEIWHGTVDIILNRNIIKVTLEDELSNIQLNKEEDDAQDLMQFAVIEGKKRQRQQLNSQVISESIVNAFYVSKQESNHNQFIPSYLVTDKYIRIIFYNVEEDILLKSTKLPIWLNERKCSLNFMTLIRVWFSLNYTGKLDKEPERYNFFLKSIKKAGFKEIVGDAYSEYLNHVVQPLKLHASRPGKKEQVKSGIDFSKYDADEYQRIMDKVLDFTKKK